MLRLSGIDNISSKRVQATLKSKESNASNTFYCTFLTEIEMREFQRIISGKRDRLIDSLEDHADLQADELLEDVGCSERAIQAFKVTAHFDQNYNFIHMIENILVHV